jgi:hypothetical protein
MQKGAAIENLFDHTKTRDFNIEDTRLTICIYSELLLGVVVRAVALAPKIVTKVIGAKN